MGDGAADSVTVNGTNDPDDIQITADGSAVEVFGAQPNLRIDHSEAANDKLTVLNGLGGADTITAGEGLAALIQPSSTAGPTSTSSPAATATTGSPASSRRLHAGGDGDDTLVWNPGDGNDLVEVRRATTRWSSSAPPETRTSATPRTTGG